MKARRIIEQILLSGEILGFYHLEDEPRYKVRRPNKGEVGCFPDFGVANSCLDVVYRRLKGMGVFCMAYIVHDKNPKLAAQNSLCSVTYGCGLPNVCRYGPRMRFLFDNMN